MFGFPWYPVTACLTVFWSQDFAYYKSGVYKHMYGENVGGHAVKLIGWGTTEEGMDYWVRTAGTT